MKFTRRNFARDVLHIPPVEAQNIRITRSHRMGTGKDRPIIAKVINNGDHNKLFGAAKALKGTKTSISKQLPPAIEERRQYGWAEYKKAKDADKKARWDPSGKLYIEGNHISKIDPVPLPTASSYSTGGDAKDLVVGASRQHETKGHGFQAISCKVTNLQEVRECKDYLLQSPKLQDVSHLSYAFRFENAVHGVKENFDSDGDIFTGLETIRTMRKGDITNRVVFIPHWISGTARHINAKERSELITQVASDALAALDAQYG